MPRIRNAFPGTGFKFIANHNDQAIAKQPLAEIYLASSDALGQGGIGKSSNGFIDQYLP